MTTDNADVQFAGYSHMSGEIYDLIYSKKDYETEASKIAEIVAKECQSGGNRILEAACGTGSYMQFLSNDFVVDGFDLSPGQVAQAKKKLPNNRIIEADMVDFDMGETYDVVICLFSSIGYLLTKENLDKAVANFARHTKPGGLVIIEPWIKSEDLDEGRISMDISNARSDLSVARMGHLTRDGNLTDMELHHLVGTPSGIEYFLEKHKLAMYSDDDFRDAYSKAGLSVEIDSVGLTGRRLCIGKKPA